MRGNLHEPLVVYLWKPSKWTIPYALSAFDRKDPEHFTVMDGPLSTGVLTLLTSPASCGLTLQPRLLAPNPLSKSSANFCGFPTAVLQTLTLRLPFLTRRRPPAFLAASHGPRAQLGLRDPSTSAVPTFQPGGRFVGGISCELSCQRGTITAAHQSLAVTVGHRASGVEVPLWTECSLGGHACIFFFTELIKDVKLDEQREQKGGILPWEVPPPPLECFPFLSKVTFSYQSDCLKMCRSSTTQDSH